MPAQVNACGKVAYRSKAHAIEVMRRMCIRFDGGQTRPYFCKKCQVWHLGRNFGGRLERLPESKGRAKERGRHYVAELDLGLEGLSP